MPVADNIPGAEVPKFRNLWEHIGKRMPRKGRAKSAVLDPLSIPVELQTALEALYGHYVKIFDQWREADIEVPPCFIVVCNNTATSKLVYDYISGFHRHHENGSTSFENGRLELFRNYDDYGNPLARPHTPADRQRAARLRGSARQGLPGRRDRRDRALPQGDRHPHR